jgi:hypothetical protein
LLDEVLERRMMLYVLAAGATLMGASTAQAKVIFTPSSAYVSEDFSIDLDNDGNTDVVLSSRAYYYTSRFYGSFTFGSAEAPVLGGLIPSALIRGQKIGSRDTFTHGLFLARNVYGPPLSGTGPFLQTSNRYLGVRFVINGQVHYGWIGFRYVYVGVAKLGGWAYETEPNKPIRAGDRGDGASTTLRSAEPTSLQLLALGHTGIADRQRRITMQTIG